MGSGVGMRGTWPASLAAAVASLLEVTGSPPPLPPQFLGSCKAEKSKGRAAKQAMSMWSGPGLLVPPWLWSCRGSGHRTQSKSRTRTKELGRQGRIASMKGISHGSCSRGIPATSPQPHKGQPGGLWLRVFCTVNVHTAGDQQKGVCAQEAAGTEPPRESLQVFY